MSAPTLDDVVAADLTVEWAASKLIDQEPAAGELIARQGPPGAGYAISKLQHGYVMRFFSTCDFELDASKTNLRVSLAPGQDPEVASVLLTSSALSCVLTLKGYCIVHASCVTLPDSGVPVAFIGPSGRGKSTMAGALCCLGADLLCDDALRCDATTESAWCFPASEQLRLRQSSMPIIKALGAHDVSVDRRMVVRRPRRTEGRQRLGLMIVPEWCTDAAPTLRRLSGSEVLPTLLAAARINTWSDPELMKQQFSALASLARVVPIVALSLPRDSVFSAPGRQLLGQMVTAAAEGSLDF